MDASLPLGDQHGEDGNLLLRAVDVEKSFAGIHVLKKVSLAVPGASTASSTATPSPPGCAPS